MRVRVQVGREGYFGHLFRRAGDVFDIPDEPKVLVKDRQAGEFFGKKMPRAFSGRWMEPVSEAVPTNLPLTHADALKRKVEEMKGAPISTGNQEVLT